MNLIWTFNPFLHRNPKLSFRGELTSDLGDFHSLAPVDDVALIWFKSVWHQISIGQSPSPIKCGMSGSLVSLKSVNQILTYHMIIVYWLHRIHSVHNAAYCNGWFCSVVCQSVTWLRCAKMAERIEIVFGVRLVYPRNVVLYWSPNSPTARWMGSMEKFTHFMWLHQNYFGLLLVLVIFV